MRRYIVTVTPKSVVWCGSYRDDGYTVEVSASSRNEAITRARRQRNDDMGRYAERCTYRAKLAD